MDPIEQRASTFLAPGTGFMEDNFLWTRARDGFRMIPEHYIYCALSFYYYYISSTSDHPALDTGGWGPLLCRMGRGDPRRMSLRPGGEIEAALLQRPRLCASI